MRTEEFRLDDGSFSKEFYSDSNRLTRVEDYSASGGLTLSVDYRYDPRGNNVERIVRDAEGRQIRRLEFEFDAHDRETVHREYDSADKLLFTRKL